jgi:hypothetical protein
MPRPCSVCRSSNIGDISADIANGVTDKEISRRYSLSKSSVQRHRQHLGAPNSAAVVATKGAAFAALAALPTREEAGSALSGIGARIDAIAEKAESAGSLAVALIGLKELRSTVEAQARLAGHLGGGATIAVQTNVSVDLGAAVKELIAAIQPDATNGSRALDRLEAIVDDE